MDSEKLLPREHQLDMWFREYEEEIREELESLRDRETNDLIVASIDQLEVKSVMKMEAAAAFLARHVYGADQKACETIMRSFLFASQATAVVHHIEIGYDLNTYMQEVFEAEDSQQKLEVDVRGYYLADNPSVRNILKYYARDIDQYRGYEYLVESSGGMIFMLIERALGRNFLQDDPQDRSLYDFEANA